MVMTKGDVKKALRDLIRANPDLDSHELLKLARNKGIKTTLMQVVGVRSVMRARREVSDTAGNGHAGGNGARATADGTKVEGNGISAGCEPVKGDERFFPFQRITPSPKQHLVLSLSEIKALGEIARRIGSWQALSEVVKSFAL